MKEGEMTSSETYADWTEYKKANRSRHLWISFFTTRWHIYRQTKQQRPACLCLSESKNHLTAKNGTKCGIIYFKSCLTFPKDPWPRTRRRSNWSGEAFSQPSRVTSITSISDTTVATLFWNRIIWINIKFH